MVCPRFFRVPDSFALYLRVGYCGTHYFLEIQNMDLDNPEYKSLSLLFATGDVTQSSHKELERYLVLLSKPQAKVYIGTNYEQACESVRMMLTVRISQKANRWAMIISVIALIVSIVSLIATIK